jgi:beta-phosphoglucomutase-like phosphatase (HAD superfamily)
MEWQTPLEGAIFDVDGTLIDSVDLHAKAWVEALLQRRLEDVGVGLAFVRVVGRCFSQVRKQIGKGGDQLMAVFLSRQDLEAYGEDLDAHCGRIFKERYLPLVVAFPGVRRCSSG